MQEPMSTVKNRVLGADSALSLIDATLENFFNENILQAKLIDSHYETLWSAIHQLAKAGGKRIRPYVTMMAYQAFSDKPLAAVIPIAAAQELLHIALLIHDDIIDRDYVRHGAANISGQYDAIYRPFITDPDERRHFSDSAAILAGDMLISGGYQLIQTSSLPADKLRQATQIYGHAIFVVAGGELLDTESAFRPSESIDAVKIARYKTAHYSFVTPLLMGARLADASPESIAALTVFGENLGIAYQLVDDLIGTFGSQTVIGKSNVSDIEEAKHTYLIEQLLQHGNPSQLATFKELFGKEGVTPEEAARFREILVNSDAKNRTEVAVEIYTKKALQALHDIPLDTTSRSAFEALVERAVRRNR